MLLKLKNLLKDKEIELLEPWSNLQSKNLYYLALMSLNLGCLIKKLIGLKLF